jgi:Big-like domain-containing protein
MATLLVRQHSAAAVVATLTRSNLNAAAYPLKAVYAGDAANLGSTSTIVNQIVLQTTSKARLTSSPNPSTQGQAVTFTARVTSPTVIPTGPVTFTAGTTVLGIAQLGGSKAKLVISSLPVGSTKVTAKYNGDSNIAKSSATVIQNSAIRTRPRNLPRHALSSYTNLWVRRRLNSPGADDR